MNRYVPPGPDQVYSQGFWHAIIAACLYMVNSMILMVNMAGYFLGHYPQHFTLTDEQRNLILQTMMFFIWLGGGAGVFARTEGWAYPDALYFCDVTILTIGFGDFYATGDLGRGLVFPYSVGGGIILGLMVSSIHKFAGELSKDKVLRKHIDRRRVNTLSRVVTKGEEEKQRDDLEKHVGSNLRHGRPPTISSPLDGEEIEARLERDAMQERQVGFAPSLKKEHYTHDTDDEPSATQFLSSRFHRGPINRTFHLIAGPVVQLHKARLARANKAIIMREEKDRFDAMRTIQMDARKFKKWYALFVSTLMFGVLWCVGAIVFWQAEKHTQGLSYFQALYFAYVSLLTIGYGDLSPRSNAGKPFFVVWSLIAVPTMTILISDMGDTVIEAFKQGTFRLADFTVLPKQGLWRDFVESHPKLYTWLDQRAEKRRIKRGIPVGPDPDSEAPPTIEQLAFEDLSEAQLTKRLAFAIRKTADDLAHDPGKRYKYEDWVEFTRLIRFTTMDITELEYDEEVDGVVEWDWLDENSPMLSEQSESEWVLDRLCDSLLRLLKKRRSPDYQDDESWGNARGLKRFDFDKTIDFGDVESVDPKSPTSDKTAQQRLPLSKAQQHRHRMMEEDTMHTYFTSERRGTNVHAVDEPQWSKKALERMKNQRKKSSGSETMRLRRFSRLIHAGRAGVGGSGRGSVSIRTSKARPLAKRFSV